MIKIENITEKMDKESLELVALIQDVTLMPKAGGNDWLNIKLVDKTGMIDAKKWQANADDKKLKAGQVIEMNATVQIYQGKVGLIIQEMKPISIDPSEFQLTSIEPVDELVKEFKGYVKNIKNEKLRKVVEHLLSQEDIKDEFYLHPAAKACHGAEKYGLLSHECLMLRMANDVCDNFNRFDTVVNKDLVMTGIIFHDIGKLTEMSRNEKTGAGEYQRDSILGHIYLGAERVHDYELNGMLDKETAFQLKHIILSHHGKLEYGSPVQPATIEAIIVNKMDGLEADVASCKDSYLRMRENELAANTNIVLGSHPFKPIKL